MEANAAVGVRDEMTRKGMAKRANSQVAEHSALLRYSVAVVSVFLAAAARLALDPQVGEHTVFLPFTAAVLVSVYFGGRGPGLASAVLSMLTVEYLFLVPRYSFAIANTWDRVGLLEFAAVSLVIIEITARLRRSLAAAAESRATASALLDSSSQAIVATTGDGCIALVNTNTEKIFGYSPGELLGQPHDVLIPERLRERHRQHHASFVSSPGAKPMATRANLTGRRKDGTEFPVEITLSSVQTARGVLSVSFVTDITERRRMEESFQQQYNLMSTITGCAAEALILVDGEGRVTFANPASERLLGWTAAELWGTELHDRVHYQTPGGAPFHRGDCPLEQVLQTGTGIHGYETEYFRKNGTRVPVSTSVAPILREGKVTGAAIVISDITERKQSEEALRRSEQRVRLKLESILSPEGDIGDLELSDILDVKAIQALMDDFYQLSGVPMSIFDLKGNLLVGVGWQEVCTRYHRLHPETAKNCLESDTHLSVGVPPGEYKLYKCLNHMWDVVTPLMIGGKQVGNLFSGQFFFEDEALDLDLFRAQAARYGFPEEEYLAAIRAAPRLSRTKMRTGMAYLAKLGQMLSLLSYSNIKLARSLAERDRLMARLEIEQQKLRDSEERLRLAIESGGLGVFDVDLRTEEFVWSTLAKQQFGLTSDADVNYQVFLRGLHPEDRERVELTLAEARRPGSSGRYSDEYRAIDSGDGQERWFSAWGRFFFDDQQRPIRLLGIRREITDRKKAEAAARASQAKLEAALASMTDAVFISDSHGQFINFNDAFATFCRFASKDQCVRRFDEYPNVVELFWPDGTPAAPEHWPVQRALRGETATIAEYILCRKDTGEKWIGSHSFAPIRGKDGEVAGSVVVARDITEQRRAAEALRESEERFRILFESMDEGFASCEMIYDEAGHPVDFRYLLVNSAFGKLTGLPVAEVTGRTVREVVPDIERFWIETYDRIVRTGRSERIANPVAALGRWFEVFAWRSGPGQFAVTFNDVTQRRRVEQALRCLSELIDLSHDAVITADASRVVRTWNAGAAELYGWTEAEAVGRVMHELLQTRSAVTIAELGAMLKRSGRWDGELAHVAKDGTPLWVESRQVLDSGGDAPTILEINRDITAPKRAQEALRESEEHLRALVNATSDVLYRMNPDWSEMRQLTGRRFLADTEGPSPDWLKKYIPPNDQARVMAALHEAIRSRKTFELEHQVLRVDGSLGWALSRAIPLLNSSGEIVEWFGAASDITLRKTAEETLRESEVQFRTLANAIPQLCWMANADGWITWYNERWYQYTGTTPREMDGWGWQSVHDPEELPRVLDRWNESIATGEPLDMVFPLRGADGVFRPFLTRVMPVCDQEGKVVRWFGTNTDISAQRQAEAALRASEEQLQRLNEQLEQRVRDRTAQLEASNKELEAFAYSVSHDLRAPLRGIDGWSLALVEDYADRLDADGRKHLAWVRSEAQRMGSMIEDLLQLSRVTRSPMQQGKVDLTQLAQTVAQRLHKSAPGRSIAFQIRPGLSAWGDPHLLEIVLTNLLENAVKYTGRKAEARIEVGRASNENAEAFYVRDNGVGFNPAYADKLFTAFQRLHKPSEFPGTGIGLATVHRIIRRHGGRVWAEAVPQEGATFYFTLAEAHSTQPETP